MEIIGFLILIYIFITWESILALPTFIVGIIALIKFHKLKKKWKVGRQKEREEKIWQDTREVHEKIEKMGLMYKEAYRNENEFIEFVSKVMSVDELYTLLKNLEEYANGYYDEKHHIEYFKIDAFDNLFFNYEKFIDSAKKYDLKCPISICDDQLCSRLKNEINWMKEIVKKPVEKLTDEDLQHIMKWKKGWYITDNYITDKEHKNIYKINILTYYKTVGKKMSYYKMINELSSNFENYTDFFGNIITFKDVE